MNEIPLGRNISHYLYAVKERLPQVGIQLTLQEIDFLMDIAPDFHRTALFGLGDLE